MLMSDASQTVPVPLGQRSYEIHIGSGKLAQLGPQVAAVSAPSQVLVVTDEHVAPLYARQVIESLASAGLAAGLLVVPPGESSKSVASISRLWEETLAAGADRKSLILALGGGVVGDLAGFLAATFARGVQLYQVPTTLLAQVDSSVGGKVGINLPSAKNIVGAFWQPRGVLIDTNVLGTLPAREFRAGMAEVVKYGVILDADFFRYLEQNVAPILNHDPAVLRHIVARCCELKAQVVAADEREEPGQRAVLNYGHTFCHAFEAATGYGQLLHGEAVAIGMICASRLAERLGRIAPEVTQRQIDLLTALGLSLEVPAVPHDRLVELMAHDKKAERGELRFVLPDRLGRVELLGGVDRNDVLAALAE